MNCHMMAGMTSSVSGATDAIALFIHQVIPHHQNAVNMAKALLKTGEVKCNSLTDEDPDCEMEIILREIISNQNAQIQVMRGILEAKSMPQTNDCTVTVSESAAQELDAVSMTQSNVIAAATSASETSESAPTNAAAVSSHSLAAVVLIAFAAIIFN